MKASASTLRKPGRRLRIGAGIVIVLAVVVLGLAMVRAKQASAPTTVPDHPITTANGRGISPPWPVPVDVADSVHDADLPMLPSAGTAQRFDVHLDIVVDGQRVAVAPLVGVDQRSGQVSPVSTHDSSGIVYIASPVRSTFSLGQFFTEWQVALDATHIGGLATGDGNNLVAYVNGRKVGGDPAAITFAAHEEIVLVYGGHDSPAPVPATFSWPQGL
ncbi:MAG TPA: hypothetical protein VHX38_21750 [Pseudonocardiaceae bacterium]|jgi:hypothetical protein|nr:hypothetical protein [Pseudonocardiaceae bacterium]